LTTLVERRGTVAAADQGELELAQIEQVSALGLFAGNFAKKFEHVFSPFFVRALKAECLVERCSAVATTNHRKLKIRELVHFGPELDHFHRFDVVVASEIEHVRS
jgi:hypothetical protein